MSWCPRLNNYIPGCLVNVGLAIFFMLEMDQMF